MNAADLPLKGLQRTFVECSLYLPHIITVYSNGFIIATICPKGVTKGCVHIYIIWAKLFIVI
jgi:hypothetical protein